MNLGIPLKETIGNKSFSFHFSFPESLTPARQGRGVGWLTLRGFQPSGWYRRRLAPVPPELLIGARGTKIKNLKVKVDGTILFNYAGK